MIKSQSIAKLVLMTIFLLTFSLGISCGSNQDFDKNLKAITEPYRFSIVKWELNAFGEGVGETFGGWQEDTDDNISEVTEYFATNGQIKRLESEIEAVKAGNGRGDLASLEAELDELSQRNASVADNVEKLLENQIRETLSQQEIFNPIYRYLKLKVSFPPVNFKMGKPPHVLVVSPRDRIESLREVTLLPDMSLEEMEEIEVKVDKLGVSSLVAEIGGISTYPGYITDRGNLRFIIDTATEEWLHQYLAFKPLGFRYLLDLAGICRDYEIATMNETLASMVSKEIGGLMYEGYYARSGTCDAMTDTVVSGFDFNQEMRGIRIAVDNYLAQGEIEQAEEFMEQKRQLLATNGYYIRKLNQAYFAFHGAYADSPTSVSPIGIEFRELRSQSASLKEFLETAAAMTSRQVLTSSLE